MKCRRFLSGLLFGLGCALAFIGLLTLALPAIPNPQLKLVLASFAIPSDNGAVRLMNRFMTFALEHSWRVLGLGAIITAVGAWLFVHFTPKQRKPQPVSRLQTVHPEPPEPFMKQEPEAPNPFAAASYNDHFPNGLSGSTASFVVHAEPILKRNQIGEVESLSEAPQAEAEPYFSSRFAAESRAIETEAGSPSQSGSRILIRSVYEAPKPAEPPVADEPVEMLVPSPEPSVEPAAEPSAKSSPLATPAPMAPLSPRIRSTMGRHGTIKRDLPASHS